MIMVRIPRDNGEELWLQADAIQGLRVVRPADPDNPGSFLFQAELWTATNQSFMTPVYPTYDALAAAMLATGIEFQQ